MNLLIVTQKVDSADPILGFFHRWLAEFSKHCEQVTVIGQLVGEHNLPDNVEVHSLGKEKGHSRLRQMIRFGLLQWKLRKQYDTVFVHMTPIWVVLGWKTWFLLRKRVYLWYEARGGGWALPLSLLFVRKVFSATEYGLPKKSKKSVITGHGIDTEYFAQTQEREKGLIVTIGRTTRTKHLDVIIKAFAQLPDSCKLFIAGGPITKQDANVLEELTALMVKLNVSDRITIQSVPHEEIRSRLQRAELTLHACGGGLDKAVLEAMACGCSVVSCSKATAYVLPENLMCSEETMGEKAKEVLRMSNDERSRLAEDLRRRVVEKHSLRKLVERLVKEME
ncbi:glycosyltransferase family 4 protein [Patescibacteria group bacterium]|nr:glycosyltransferase family 4 protein [Patescibacteria group bacterium]MBU2259380.1 glycosyltransferase family 4 protein [Patescibacteria group bacterium]